MGETKIETNLYDFNKTNMSQIEPLDPIWFNKKCNEIAKDILAKGQYWMLLCRERYDITVFDLKNASVNKVSTDLIEVLNNRGQILDLVCREDNSYEIWIRDIDTKENFVYYLFDYSFGIINY